MPMIANGRMSLQTLCLHGSTEDQRMCIEGAMERMAKYDEARALSMCQDVQGHNQDICLTAVHHKMYHVQKDFSLYLHRESPMPTGREP
jgi:hypothetical protein